MRWVQYPDERHLSEFETAPPMMWHWTPGSNDLAVVGVMPDLFVNREPVSCLEFREAMIEGFGILPHQLDDWCEADGAEPGSKDYWRARYFRLLSQLMMLGAFAFSRPELFTVAKRVVEDYARQMTEEEWLEGGLEDA